MRGGFITDTIPGYNEDLHTERENDWICIVDFLSSYCEALRGATLNICAWYNKRTKLCHFGGQWAYDVPSCEFYATPSEESVWAWAEKHSWVCKRMSAYWRKEAKRKEDNKRFYKEQKKNGINFAYVKLEKNGELFEIFQPVGNRNELEALRLVSYNIESSPKILKREKREIHPKYGGAIVKKLIIKKTLSARL